MLLAWILFAALPTNVQLRIQPDEAKAVVEILDQRAAHKPLAESDWQALFATEGYIRLQKREHAMKRKFENDDFQKFVMSEELLARRAELHHVVDDWSHVDLGAAGRQALAYLPPDAKISATVYPVIKPARNNFVFEGNAIFMTVEDQPRERFETIVTHELHHIGYDSACPAPAISTAIEKLPPNLHALENWLTAFGEGYATLAAGGDHDPEHAMQPEVQKAFVEGSRDLDKNFHDVETFLLDVLDGRLSGDAVRDRGFQFLGMVGPWYTVGWKMCVVIEKTLGREALINAFCDPRTLLGTYNKAAGLWKQRTGESLPAWDERLVNAFTSPSSETPARSPGSAR
ncbi:MAG TPA: DUF5700 domain-containing putative Zn-dependent protease [Thermoanaerobaculia bacterium]|nr:DUF5700 domain-containing putative Zn-dependent protease [Thermoanaerobaculia bacterium]